jgi:hypothetical protein
MRGASLEMSLRAAFLRAESGTVSVTGGAAAFTWDAGRIDGCAIPWPGHALSLGACVRVEAGVLDVAGTDISAPQSRHSAWLALAPLAHLEWALLGSLFLEAQAGPTFRLTADRFFFLPDITTGYRVPVVALDAEGGVGVHFL